MGINTGDNNQNNQTQMGAKMEDALSQQARTGHTDRRQGNAGQGQRDDNPSAGAHRASDNRNEGRGFSFRSMGNLSRTAMGRNPTSEALSKLVKALTTVYTENADKSFEVQVLPVDMNSNTALSVSIAIIAVRDRQYPQLGVAFHTLIVAASTEDPAPRFENIGGTNTEITRVIGESYNSDMIQVVRDTVIRAYGTNVPLVDADAEVVPRTFDLQDPQTVYTLAANAVFACSQELETHGQDFHDLNLANAERDSNLNVRISYGNSEILDAVGQPVHGPIAIDFTATDRQQQQGNERVSVVSQIRGFLDLIYAPQNQQQNQGGWAQPVQSFQRYAARFVITQLESKQLLTIPAQLLALLPALSLRENNQWVQAFRNPPTVDGVDLYDFGAVGIEVNFENNPSGVGSRIDTRADSFKPEHLHKLVASTVSPGLVISLDVPECGPSTWHNGVFAAAAAGNPRANAAIADAANQLFNGEFAKYWNGGRVCFDEDNRIHLGNFADRSGVRRDLRGIDQYLAQLNLIGEKDLGIVRDWSDTHVKTGYPLALRLAGRKRILTNEVNDVKITGYARRVTFEADFLEALAKAAVACGLNVRTMAPYADMGSFERASGDYLRSAMMGSGNTGMFNQGGGFGSNAGVGNRGFGFGRW
jgi:hypothetical protein